MTFDLVLTGGHVIDPGNGVDGPMDVAVGDGRIAAVGPGLGAGASRCVDVSGLHVTPGLIDIHLHAFGGFNAWLFPDPYCLSCGVTTAVDTGSSGFKDFERFRETIMEPSTTRVLAFLNIVGAGMTGPRSRTRPTWTRGPAPRRWTATGTASWAPSPPTSAARDGSRRVAPSRPPA